ncbi:methyl-accepting chemotaxis protein [Emcibacter nanhaiensis]|uniref:Chemotaxis protein n=1 Tax=Emcibacter nanhaiensis TaxID=1505037 RepID=A0A501PMQ1_9PROT|nr:methyl-accepting chemotaxis protein [Emcibacter nanhaiensis]TPD61723.1 chemotaxis protein [Emcibacter nanhaiensis]
MHNNNREAIEQSLTLILEGKFEDVPAGICPISNLIKSIADSNLQRVRKNLNRTVQMSVTANQGVAGVAEMMRDIKEVDSQSHSIAGAVDSLTHSVDEIYRNTSDAAQEIASVSECATASLDAAQKAQGAMGEIADSVEHAAGKVNDLSLASEDIGKIVKDIEDIAKQTNLLALNATIEAARAGEAGKGFAVVANEVKNLASQTAEATETIRNRIENLRSEMAAIVSAMNEGNEKASQGKEIIDASAGEMTRISDKVHVVSSRIAKINGILEQQISDTQNVARGAQTIAVMSAANVKKINQVIDVLEATEAPILDGVNDLIERGGKRATVCAAKSDHMIWMRKLSQMLAGRISLNADELSDHHSCRLGKWYDQQNDPGLTSLPQWAALKEPHRAVHEAGIRATRLFNRGDIDGAVEAVHEADAASQKVMEILDKLSSEHHNLPSHAPAQTILQAMAG